MPVVPDPATLSEFPLFRDLTIEQLTRLNDLLRRRTFPAGTNLASAEEPGEVVYLILNGTVKIFVTQADCNDVIIAFGGPGDVEGEMSVLDNVAAGRSADIVTQEQTTVLWLDRVNFQDCMRTMPAIALTLLRILSGVMEPTCGRVLLDGVELRQYSPEFLARHLGALVAVPRSPRRESLRARTRQRSRPRSGTGRPWPRSRSVRR